MKPARKRRLLIVGFILLGIGGAVSLLFAALGNNMNHYYELTAIESGEAPIGKTIRIGGMVEKDSIKRNEGSLKVSFGVTDFTRRLQVNYEGILPDLFREGQGVLAKGKLLDKQTFVAEEILAKHDENYMPKEVRKELEKSGYYKHGEGNNTETKPNVGNSNVGSSNVGSSNVGSSNVGSSNVGSSNVGSSNVGSSNVGSD